MAYAGVRTARLDELAIYGTPSDPSKREFFKKGMALLVTAGAAKILPRYLAKEDEGKGNLDNRLSREHQIYRAIENYNVQRAQDLLLYSGEKAPELIYKLGLERHLRGSQLEQELIKAGVVSSTYNSSSPRIAEFLYDAWQRLKRDLPIIAAGVATACGGPTAPTNGNGNGNPPPTSNYAVRGSAQYMTGDGAQNANGTVSLIDGNGKVVKSGSVTNGSYSLEFPLNEEGVKQIESIRRIRFTGNSFLSSELRTVVGKSQEPSDEGKVYNALSALLVGRVPELIPEFAHKVNHNAIQPYGHHKVVDPITYIADMSTQVGSPSQSPGARLAVTRQSIEYVHTPTTGFGTFEFKEGNRPSQGNGNHVIRYGGGSFSNPQLDVYRITGGLSSVPSAAPNTLTDNEEIASTNWFIGAVSDRPTSIGNQPSSGTFSNDDLLVLKIMRATEALGANKVTAPDGTTIESYEP